MTGEVKGFEKQKVCEFELNLKFLESEVNLFNFLRLWWRLSRLPRSWACWSARVGT